jgi:hypothetical protein
MKKNNMPALLGALACCLAAPASAALFRCGNAFQDRPCENPSQQEVLRPVRSGTGIAPTTARAASAPAMAASAAHVASAPAAAAPAGASNAAAATVVRKGPPSLACPNLREQRNAIEARLRAGGRPETIQMYQRQLREMDRNLDEANCG